MALPHYPGSRSIIDIPLICSCCGYVGKQYPGLMYMDMFYRKDCSCCGSEGVICGPCLQKSQMAHHGGTTRKVECKSCNRDRKIEEVLNG